MNLFARNHWRAIPAAVLLWAAVGPAQEVEGVAGRLARRVGQGAVEPVGLHQARLHQAPEQTRHVESRLHHEEAGAPLGGVVAQRHPIRAVSGGGRMRNDRPARVIGGLLPGFGPAFEG